MVEGVDYSDTTAAVVANVAPLRAYNYGLAGFDCSQSLKINWLWNVPGPSKR